VAVDHPSPQRPRRPEQVTDGIDRVDFR